MHENMGAFSSIYLLMDLLLRDVLRYSLPNKGHIVPFICHMTNKETQV